MTRKTTNTFSPEVRARAVRMMLDHEAELPSRWQAIVSIATKIGCSAHALNAWPKAAEVDSGNRAEVTTDMSAKLQALKHENRELRQANEILRMASADFAPAELDRRSKRGSLSSTIIAVRIGSSRSARSSSLCTSAGLVHQRDRGAPYVSLRDTERLAKAGIEPSAGSVGDSHDSALAEMINGLDKAEVIHRRGR